MCLFHFFSSHLLCLTASDGFYQGVYGENGSVVYPQSYGYAAYPYSPATSPGPQVGGDGQLYGAQQYQYPAFFPTGPFATPTTQGDLSANKAGGVKTTLPAESKGVASGAASMAKGSNGTTAPGKPNNQTTASNLYGNGAPGGGFAGGYQDPRYGYDGFYAPVPCYDGSKYSDVQRSGSGVASSYSKSNTVPSSRNQNYRSNSHYTV